jgi:hypothetical protein
VVPVISSVPSPRTGMGFAFPVGAIPIALLVLISAKKVIVVRILSTMIIIVVPVGDLVRRSRKERTVQTVTVNVPMVQYQIEPKPEDVLQHAIQQAYIVLPQQVSIAVTILKSVQVKVVDKP